MPKHDEQTLIKHKAYAPLLGTALKDEARQLLEAYLRTFAAAPEADFLLKRYFFDRYHYKQQYLQKNKLFIRNYSGPGHGVIAAGGAAMTSWMAWRADFPTSLPVAMTEAAAA